MGHGLLLDLVQGGEDGSSSHAGQVLDGKLEVLNEKGGDLGSPSGSPSRGMVTRESTMIWLGWL
jgi:hypothetical protein